jgi:hypothetical protein
MKWIWCALFLLSLNWSALADEQTRRVEEELRKRNIYFGDVDGRRTPEFAGALRHYQERKGFKPTGESDPETLYSLGLASEPPHGRTEEKESEMSSWPDITVLKSDSRRDQSNEPPSPSPLPVMESPPTAQENEERFPLKQVREFIESYLSDAKTNNLEAEMSYYSDPLNYFDHGIVDRPFVERDVKSYYKRWPQREYKLLELSQTPAETHPDETVVKFRIHFTVKNDEHSVQGLTDNFFTLKSTGAGNFKIIAMREQRVRP